MYLLKMQLQIIFLLLINRPLTTTTPPATSSSTPLAKSMSQQSKPKVQSKLNNFKSLLQRQMNAMASFGASQEDTERSSSFNDNNNNQWSSWSKTDSSSSSAVNELDVNANGSGKNRSLFDFEVVDLYRESMKKTEVLQFIKNRFGVDKILRILVAIKPLMDEIDPDNPYADPPQLQERINMLIYIRFTVSASFASSSSPLIVHFHNNNIIISFYFSRHSLSMT